MASPLITSMELTLMLLFKAMFYRCWSKCKSFCSNLASLNSKTQKHCKCIIAWAGVKNKATVRYITIFGRCETSLKNVTKPYDFFAHQVNPTHPKHIK